MAIVEMAVKAPERLDTPEEIRKVDEELRQMYGLIVLFYTPPPQCMPVRMVDGNWLLRFVEKHTEGERRGQINRGLLTSLKEKLERFGFVIKDSWEIGNGHVEKGPRLFG